MEKKIKLELVQYPYSKSGPTLYLDDEKIAGPKAFGVGKTIYSFEVDPNDLTRICSNPPITPISVNSVCSSRNSKLELHDGLLVRGFQRYGKSIQFYGIGHTIGSASRHCSSCSTINECFNKKNNLISDLIGDNPVDTIRPLGCNRSDLEDGKYEILFTLYVDDADNKKTWIINLVFQDVDVTFNLEQTMAILKDAQN